MLSNFIAGFVFADLFKIVFFEKKIIQGHTLDLW